MADVGSIIRGLRYQRQLSSSERRAMIVAAILQGIQGVAGGISAFSNALYRGAAEERSEQYAERAEEQAARSKEQQKVEGLISDKLLEAGDISPQERAEMMQNIMHNYKGDYPELMATAAYRYSRSDLGDVLRQRKIQEQLNSLKNKSNPRDSARALIATKLQPAMWGEGVKYPRNLNEEQEVQLGTLVLAWGEENGFEFLKEENLGNEEKARRMGVFYKTLEEAGYTSLVDSLRTAAVDQLMSPPPEGENRPREDWTAELIGGISERFPQMGSLVTPTGEVEEGMTARKVNEVISNIAAQTEAFQVAGDARAPKEQQVLLETMIRELSGRGDFRLPGDKFMPQGSQLAGQGIGTPLGAPINKFDYPLPDISDPEVWRRIHTAKLLGQELPTVQWVPPSTRQRTGVGIMPGAITERQPARLRVGEKQFESGQTDQAADYLNELLMKSISDETLRKRLEEIQGVPDEWQQFQQRLGLPQQLPLWEQ